MGRLVAGDADAIRTLYTRFGPPIYSLGIRMLGSSESAEELTQDVFVTAWRKGRQPCPFRGAAFCPIFKGQTRRLRPRRAWAPLPQLRRPR